ncbi:hypothetical protein D3C87_766520 [compost metagenome]
MNVYKVNGYWIAAESPEEAFGQFMEETDSLDDIFIGDLVEGEEDQVTVNIKRLTAQSMNVKTVPCCTDGCDECEELDDHVYYTYQELIDGKKEGEFPCILAIEE